MGFKKKLSQNEILSRENFLLNYGLSRRCLLKLKEINYRLVKKEEAKKRLDNLTKLGFKNLSSLLISNPTVLFRSEKSVKIRFFMIWGYLQFSGEGKNIFYLLTIRRQLWSSGIEKMAMVILLAKEKKDTANFGRLCSMLTLAIEDILLAYFQDKNSSFPCIYTEAKKRISKSGLSKSTKRRCLEKIGDPEWVSFLRRCQ